MTDHEHHHVQGINDPSHPHSAPLSDVQPRVRALESLLLEKGLVDPAALDELIDQYETRVGPRNGAQVVARAWTDPDFKTRLLQDATSTLAAGHAAGLRLSGEWSIALMYCIRQGMVGVPGPSGACLQELHAPVVALCGQGRRPERGN
jgi:hypothetical protein